MSQWYTFTQEVKVTDAVALYHAARAVAVEEAVSADEIEDLLGTPENPDIAGCIMHMLDTSEDMPGLAKGHGSVEKVAG